MDAYTLAAALERGISVRSTWDSPSVKEFPASGRTVQNPVRDTVDAPCQPRCTLAEAVAAPLNVPYFAVTERVGAAAVIDKARAAGIDTMWLPGTGDAAPRRFDVAGSSGVALSPEPFDTEVGLGSYPVTVLDQANAMATFAAGGRRAGAHFVRRVSKDFAVVYTENTAPVGTALAKPLVDDLTWALSQGPVGTLPGGRVSAAIAGTVRLRTSAVENAHAWVVGYTPNLAAAVWIGNEETEFPLRDALGGRVSGPGLPADIYRGVMAGVADRLGLPRVDFATPTFTGNASAGDAR
jgi:membrane peptidoglycan carboxypeptidase